MGTFLILLQGILNLLLLAVAALWYRSSRREAEERQRITACLNVLESHGARREQEWGILRTQLQDQLKALHRICEDAKGILSQSQNGWLGEGHSREEKDLQEAAQTPAKAEPVPTVTELERIQTRPKPQGWLDLKTLLREQLV